MDGRESAESETSLSSASDAHGPHEIEQLSSDTDYEVEMATLYEEESENLDALLPEYDLEYFSGDDNFSDSSEFEQRGSAEELIPDAEPLHWRNAENVVENNLPVPSEAGSTHSADESMDSNYSEDAGSLDEEELLDENIHDHVNAADSPLYPGAPVTLSQALVAILTFSSAYNLSATCVADLLSLISLLIISQPVVIKSLFRFKQFFSMMKTALHYHFYCTVCFRILNSKSDECENCPNGSKTGYFLTMSIAEQLRNLYKRKGFSKLVNFRNTRIKKNASNYEDMYDGRFYQKNAGFLTGHNISFMWNSDGVAIFKSSKFNVWPFYLIINELPYGERYKEENLILAGMWLGKKKPAVNLFLSKLRGEFESLFSEGIEVISPDLPQPFNVRAMVLCGTCDLPAKALFLNMVQYNGYFSCSRCLIEGERSERTRFCHSFPADEDSRLRNYDDQLRYAAAAQDGDQPVFGVKGPTLLRFIVPDCYRSTAIGLMHSVFGLAKRLMHLWFEAEFNDRNFSLRAHLSVVSNFVTSVTPPSSFKRLPRSISDHLSYWKASKLKSWLLFYSIVILREVMNEEYFNHHLMLVYAVYMLSQESISEEMIAKSSLLLREYVTKFQHLYGLKYLIMNVHVLLHLPDCVRDFGPLWTTSCFRFEDLNGKLKRHVHGTRYADLQICSYVSRLINLSSTIQDLPVDNPVRSFCLKLASHKNISVNENIGGGFHSVGKCYKSNVNAVLVTEALITINAFGNVTYFPAVLKRHLLIRSHTHDIAVKTSSSCISFTFNNETDIGIVKHFIKVTQCQCVRVCNCDGSYYAVVTVMNKENPFSIRYPQIEVSYVYRVSESATTIAVPVRSIKTVCILMRFDANKVYVCEPPNTKEVE